MSRPDKLTAIREPNDLDIALEAAWAACGLWVATPMLLYASLERAREILTPGYVSWYDRPTEKAENRPLSKQAYKANECSP